jgi:glycosyltransferase involved in cell wall biosynthesis
MKTDIKKSEQPWVVYVGPFNFPNGGAAAQRILGNALSLHEAGYKVSIISGYDKPNIKYELPEFLEVIYTEERKHENLPSFLKRLLYISMGKKTYQWLDSQEKKPDYVILYSGYTPYILWLRSFCKKHQKPFIFDAVEWYEQDSLLKNIFSPYQINIEIAMRLLLPQLNGLIVISGYLENYYKKYNIKKTKIPPTLDIEKIKSGIEKKQKDCLKICYTGTPAKKDCLNEVFEAIEKAITIGLNIQLNLAGVSETDLLSYQFFKKRKIKNVPDYIICHGKIPHQAALKLVRSSDFSILFRFKTRMSNAGFSTKLVESLAVGTPLLANITSDMGDILFNEYNSLICSSVNSEEILLIIRKAYSLTEQEHLNMRINARITAEKNFDFRHYSKKINQFLNSVSG